MQQNELTESVIYEKIAAFAKGEEDKQTLLCLAQEEKALPKMLDEERLQYAGSMVLGLNDALVELPSSLAGFAFALQNTRVIVLIAPYLIFPTGSILGR